MASLEMVNGFFIGKHGMIGGHFFFGTINWGCTVSSVFFLS